MPPAPSSSAKSPPPPACAATRRPTRRTSTTRSTARTSSVPATASRLRRARKRIPAPAVRRMSEDKLAEALERHPEPRRLWLALASQRKRLGLAARRVLAQGGQRALRGQAPGSPPP